MERPAKRHMIRKTDHSMLETLFTGFKKPKSSLGKIQVISKKGKLSFPKDYWTAAAIRAPAAYLILKISRGGDRQQSCSPKMRRERIATNIAKLPELVRKP